MKKKIIAFTGIMVICLSFLCACGSTSNTKYGDYTKKQLASAVESTAEQLNGMSAKEVKQYYSHYTSEAKNADTDTDKDKDEMYASLFKSWSEVLSANVGSFQGYKSFDVIKSGKTVTATLKMQYEKRDVELVYTFNSYNMKVTAINANVVYSISETMAKAGLNTLMGMGTVFAILILISLLIYALRIIPYIESKKQRAALNETEENSDQKPEQEDMDSTELIAVITAAVSAQTGASTDDFVVRSIKRR